MESKRSGIATARIIVGIIATVLGAFSIYESYNVYIIGSLAGEKYSQQGAMGLCVGLFLLIGGLISAATSSSLGGGITASGFMVVAVIIGFEGINQRYLAFQDLYFFAFGSFFLAFITIMINWKQRRAAKLSAYNEENDEVSDDTHSDSISDEIMKYKQLLDEGAITQEEYDKVKQRLLDI